MMSMDKMLEEIRSIDPLLLQLLVRVHPIFDRGLSLEGAGRELGIGEKKARDMWRILVEKYPMVKTTIRQHSNPLGIDRGKLRNPIRCGNMSSVQGEASELDTVFGEKIVRKF